MRILILSNVCPPYVIGGYEIACANVAAGLRARGHEVRLATTRSHVPGDPDPPYVERCFGLHWYQPVPPADAGVHRHLLFHSSVSDEVNSAELLRLLQSFQPDIAYAWNLFGIGGIALLDLLNTMSVPWVMHLMDNLPHPLLSGAPAHVRSVFGGAASDLFSRGRVIAMSDALVGEVLSETGVAFDGGVEIVPGWVDLRELPDALAERHGAARFVAASRVAEHKGIHLILEAAASLRTAGVTGFTVDIFGAGEVPRFIDMAQRLGVQDIVRFLGHRSQTELLSLYAGYHAFLFPTWEREPFGFAPIEAAACGCVPILTRQCGAAERLVDVAHCIKIDRTAAALADAMRQVVEGVVDLPAMARRVSTAVRADLGFGRALARIEAILEEEARAWDCERANDPRLPLLLHTKHHLAMAMMFGV